MVCTIGPIAQPVRAAADSGSKPPRAALAARCDELVRVAVRSPYGWGWTPEVATAEGSPADAEDDEEDGKGAAPGGGRPANRRRKPAAAAPAPRRTVAIDGRATALIGLELFWAGDLLGNPQYKQAAFEAGRGLSAIQTRTGQVRARGAMGAFGGPGDPAADVPDRTATLAALGLWLTMIDAAKTAPPANATGAALGAAGPAEAASNAPPPGTGNRPGPAPKPDDRLTQPATVAVHWLTTQQTPAGAWPTGYPADAQPGKGTRIVRLDMAEFRDTTLTMLLAAEVLDRRDLRANFDRCLDNLLSVRIAPDDGLDRTLWIGVYDLQGQPTRRIPEFGNDVDLLASRHAMQVLLTAYLVTLDPKGDESVRAAVKSIEGLTPQDGPASRWHRFYDRRGKPTIPPQPTTRPGEGRVPRGMFARPDEAPEPADDTVDLGPLLRLAHQAADRGGPDVAKQLAGRRPFNRRLAELACGFSDDPLSDRTPSGDRPDAAQPGHPAHPAPRALQQPGQAAELWELLRQAESASQTAPPPSVR